jgi:hypothetical protein
MFFVMGGFLYCFSGLIIGFVLLSVVLILSGQKAAGGLSVTMVIFLCIITLVYIETEDRKLFWKGLYEYCKERLGKTTVISH